MFLLLRRLSSWLENEIGVSLGFAINEAPEVCSIRTPGDLRICFTLRKFLHFSKMISRIFIACLFLGMYSTGSLLGCKWIVKDQDDINHQFHVYNNRALGFLDMMVSALLCIMFNMVLIYIVWLVPWIWCVCVFCVWCRLLTPLRMLKLSTQWLSLINCITRSPKQQ